MCTAPHPALALFKRLFEEAEASDPIAMPKDYVQRNWLWDQCAKNGIEVPANPIQAWEWEEEIGLARDRVDIVGALADYDMPSGFRISPVVGWIEPPLELKLDPVEVDSAFEVPLSFILDPANHQRRSYDFNNRHRSYLAMPYHGHYIWGATAAMLYSLYRQLKY